MPRSFWGCQEFEKNQADSYRLESCENFFTTHWSLVLKTGLSREALRATTCLWLGLPQSKVPECLEEVFPQGHIRELAFSESPCELCVVSLPGL